MRVGGDAQRVVLELPGTRQYVRLARLLAGGFATSNSTSLEVVDDARIAAGEICASLIEAGRGAPISLTFTARPDALLMEGSVEDPSEPALDDRRQVIGHRILAVLAEQHTFTRMDGRGVLTVAIPLER